MKKFIILTFITVFTLGITSCKKSSDETPSEEGEEQQTSEFYISYKANGTLITETIISGQRGASTDPRTLTVSGTGADGANPKFKFFTTESFIGFVNGLTVGCSTNSATSNYVEYTNSAGLLHTTKTDSNGITVGILEVSYTNGGSVRGTFDGTVKSGTGSVVNITEGKFKVKFSN
jgi:hypothetical protein